MLSQSIRIVLALESIVKYFKQDSACYESTNLKFFVYAVLLMKVMTEARVAFQSPCLISRLLVQGHQKISFALSRPAF